VGIKKYYTTYGQKAGDRWHAICYNYRVQLTNENIRSRDMTKRWNRGVLKILTFLITGVLGQGVIADGYRNPPPTAEGIARGGANMIFSDDASAVFYNPANLAFQTNASIVAGVTFARQETTFKSATAGVSSADSDGDWNVLPNIFLSIPLSDSGVVLGLGISTPFGQGIEYDKEDFDGVGALLGGDAPAIYKAEIKMVNFNPTIAFKLGENFAVGIGADIYYSELEFKQFYPWTDLPPIPFALPFDQDIKAEGSDFSFGGNLALTWDITERQRMAFSYRSEFKMEYDGDDLKASPNGVVIPPQLVRSDFDLDIKYPTVLGVGYGIVLTDTINVEANLEWVEWSVNETLSADLGVNGELNVPQDWDDTITISVGGDWSFADNWVLNAGYAFIETPIPEKTIAPILPDADRHVLSIGLGYSMGGHTLDLSYAYSIYDDLDVDDNQVTSFNGDYDIDSDLVGLTYSYSF
jgi:long-chain fatty acid transport protein